MSEPTTSSPLDPALDGEYRPLSVLAIAALVLAGFYSLLVAISSAVTLLTGDPLFLPAVTLIVPLAAILLGLAALHRIKDSGQLIAGRLLALWAIGLSAVAGLGFGTFTLFTGLAVQDQADRFLRGQSPAPGFFPLLLKGDAHSAFLLTERADVRQGANPRDLKWMRKHFDVPLSTKSPRGKLTIFEESGLVRLLKHYGEKEVTIEPAGIKDWVYEDGGYRVERNYLVRTPEGAFEIPLVVQSFDSDEGAAGRQWMVVPTPIFGRLPPPVEQTPLGKQYQKAREQTFHFATYWLRKWNEWDRVETFLLTLPPDQAKALRGRLADMDRMAVARLFGRAAGLQPGIWNLAAEPLGNWEELNRHLLPGYADFAALPFVKTDHVQAPAEYLIQRVKGDLPRLLASAPQVRREDAGVCPVTTKDGTVRVVHAFETTLDLVEGVPEPMSILVVGEIIVEAPEDSTFQNQGAPWRLAEIVLDRIVKYRTEAK